MPDIQTMLFIDSLLVVVCGFLFLRFARASHSHPGTIYFCFHIFTVTIRLWAISTGATTLFTDWGWPFVPVTEQEIVRAALLFNIALVVMTIAWIKAAADDYRRHGKLPLPHELPPPNLSVKHIWRVGVIVFPIGLGGLLFIARLPGEEVSMLYLGGWERSAWLTMTQTWIGLTTLVFIYWYGFRKPLVLLMALYLFLMLYQGFHRFRIFIPIILLVQIYLDRNQRRWPSKPLLMLVLAASLLFFPAKTVGRLLHQGASITEIVSASTEIINTALRGEAGDQKFLDQFASALTLIDEHGEVLYGRMYGAILTLPIPRPLWPGKPGLADYVRDFSRPWRPMAQAGMIVTFLGEAYANFRYVGIVVVPFLLAYWLTLLYFKAYRSNYFSVSRFSYLLIACNLIQVYRDGLISILVFTLINMMPLALVVLLHYISPFDPAKKLTRYR